MSDGIAFAIAAGLLFDKLVILGLRVVDRRRRSASRGHGMAGQGWGGGGAWCESWRYWGGPPFLY